MAVQRALDQGVSAHSEEIACWAKEKTAATATELRTWMAIHGFGSGLSAVSRVSGSGFLGLALDVEFRIIANRKCRVPAHHGKMA
jgi:hypothetical protein